MRSPMPPPAVTRNDSVAAETAYGSAAKVSLLPLLLFLHCEGAVMLIF
jgi:hypothetical protein